MARRHRRLRHHLLLGLLIVVLAVLLYAGLGPHPVPETFHQEDKIYHMAGFGALAVSTRLAFPRGNIVWQAAAMLAVGAGIELLQIFQPARTATIYDFLVDAVGVLIGLALARLPIIRRCAD